MSKRARNIGSEAVRVAWPAGAVIPEGTAIVEPNHLLPDDVPAAVRDELAKHSAYFAEVQESAKPDTSAQDEEKK